MPIELSKPRVFAFEDRKRPYSLSIKPLPEKVWLKYFAAIVSLQETNSNGDQSSSYDSTGPRLELLETNLIDATGYTGEGTPISSIEGWQNKLPMAHRRAAADFLVSAEIVPPSEDSLLTLGQETVTLKALWTATDEGRMQEVTGLTHTFNSPTSDHQKRYSRAMSRSIVTGGSRTGQTRWLGAQDVLIQIYDELIAGVSGYTMNGVTLSGDELKLMDAYHKVAATQALFTPLEIPAQ